MNLTKEKESLAMNVTKLTRDLAKLETFKRQLIKSLSDKSGQQTEPVDIRTVDFFFWKCCITLQKGEDDPELPVEGLSPVTGGIVALGNFDALHIGHRELAIQAARVGTPYLLSFVGMAQILGWKPRASIVAKCDRKRVLSSWSSHCGDIAPAEFEIEFASVRHLNPQQFVEKLSRELRVCGVVAGENYRFRYRASGDAFELVRLCEEYGISDDIINSVMDKNQVCGIAETEEDSKLKERGRVSSTRVRHALAAGDVRYVTELLGRPHWLISRARTQDITSKGGKFTYIWTFRRMFAYIW